MMQRIAATTLLFCCLCAYALQAEEITITAYPDNVLNKIDHRIYSHFLEHIYHSCNGGLWGELIWDRSFEVEEAVTRWTYDKDCVVQEGLASNVRLVFGQNDWKDYEFTVEARKTGGSEGFLILLRAKNDQAFYWANIGGWNNVETALERSAEGSGQWQVVSRPKQMKIETGKWYVIRARCEGPKIQVWLNGETVIDYTDDGQGSAYGQAGVGTWCTQAEFKNFKVTSLDGKVLHEGLPPLPEEKLGTAPKWYAVGEAEMETISEEPLNGKKCKQIKTSTAMNGLVQQPMQINSGEVYRGSFWVRGEAPNGLVVQLKAGDAVLARQELPAPEAQWTEMPFELKPEESSSEAGLQILLQDSGTIWLDQVSLMPESWRKAGGFRPDLLNAVKDLRPATIRWPGGCFASPYRWKDGIGPQHKRFPHPVFMWDDVEVNAFGTDEFIALCREVGAEPIIVINIGTKYWNESVQDNDFLQEALDWLEYCNGPKDSTWGKVRAANGHPEPYNVKYWEIDNETWHMGADAYAEAVNRFGAAFREADSSIALLACGSGDYDQNWNREIINKSGKNFDYISTHHYENPDNFASGPAKDELFYQELKSIIDKGPNPNIKIYCSEWNAQSTDWRTGLYAGGILNVFERCGEFFEMACPALFLRHISASGWDNAFINFDHRSWFPAPNYVVMKLWYDNFAPYLIELEGDPGSLNLTATKSENGGTIYIKAVNPTEEATSVTLKLGNRTIAKATFKVVAPGDLRTRNTLDDPDKVRPENGTVKVANGSISFDMPAYSAGVVTINTGDE
jgi:alpha-L-arabinofuranosidase